MTITAKRPFGQRYAFVVVGIVFLSLLAAAGLRATPGVLLVPWEKAFGWDRSVLSFAAAVGICLYGLVGPFAAAFMQRFGIKRVLMTSLAVMALSTGASAFMVAPWQLVLTWGVLSGLASGGVAVVLGAAVVSRWFVKNRGLMMGILTASTATGTLIFLPLLALIAEHHGWRPVVLTVAGVCAILLPLVAWLMPERPGDVGLTPYGGTSESATQAPTHDDPFRTAIVGLVKAARSGDFWLLFGTFFICGFTTNGLVGTHLIAFCADQGLPEVRAASLLALMGVFDLFGTTISGWLTDRVNARKLLFVYYGVRGLSLIFLTYSDFSFYGLSIFAVFYGLDWIATVPPTVRLTNEAFGERAAPVVFGWVVAGHQIGAASAAYFAGMMRSIQGNYLEAFTIAGLTGVLAAFMSLMIARSSRGAATAAA